MSDRIKQAIDDLRDLVRCKCDPSFTHRGLHDPSCNCDSSDAVQVIASALSTRWKDIATAPKDGTSCLVFRPHGRDRGGYAVDAVVGAASFGAYKKGEWAWTNDDYPIFIEPTHWYDFGDGKSMPDAPEVE